MNLPDAQVRALQFLFGLILWLAAGLALAQAPLRVIVPFAPGGGGDLLARLLAPELARELRLPVVIENMAGANGAIGMQRVKNAGRDERVVVLASDHASVSAALTSSATRYDTRKDFAVVGYAASFPYALAVAGGSGGSSPDGNRCGLRSRDPFASIAVPAEGGIPDLIADALARSCAVQVTTVPYRGGSAAAMALLGGQVTAAAVGISNVLQLHQDGKLRILAVSGSRRSAIVPEVPTFEELGFAGLALTSGWAVYAARNTSMDVVQLNRALRRTLSQEGVQAKLRALGLEPLQLTVDESAFELEQASALWARLLQSRTARGP